MLATTSWLMVAGIESLMGVFLTLISCGLLWLLVDKERLLRLKLLMFNACWFLKLTFLDCLVFFEFLDVLENLEILLTADLLDLIELLPKLWIDLLSSFASGSI
jgi:hypothetical protein